MESEAAVAALGALAQETRLEVFRALVRAGPEGLPAGRIAAALALPAPTLSFHLAQLARAGLVARRREGRRLVYSADFGGMAELIAFLTRDCCGGAPEVCAPAAATARGGGGSRPPRRGGRRAATARASHRS